MGLDRTAATEAFAKFLDDSQLSVDQIRFVELIVEELTSNGVMEPGRLYESPYTDQAPTGPDFIFSEAQVDALAGTLREVRARALPQGAA